MPYTRFYLPPKILNITIHNRPYVSGHYVYLWRDGREVFYIGMGTNRRAWNDHLPLPENRRRVADKFMVQILRHQLNKAQAHYIERLYIAQYTSKGCTLLNDRIPRKV